MFANTEAVQKQKAKQCAFAEKGGKSNGSKRKLKQMFLVPAL